MAVKLRVSKAAVQKRLRFIHDASLHLGLDPLKMAPPAAFGLADEEPERAEDLPAEVPATDDAEIAPAEQPEDAADLGAEDLQVADDDASEDADHGSEHADHHASEETEDDNSETAHQVPCGATKCAHCKKPFSSGEPPEMKYHRLYHRDCVKWAKRIVFV